MTPEPATPLRLPPLPPQSRIRVVRSELAPEPILEVQIAAELAGWSALWTYLFPGGLGFSMWGVAVWESIDLAAAGRWGWALTAFGWSGAALAGAGFFFWIFKEPTTRLGLTASADGVVAERVWFGRLQTDVLRFAPEPSGKPSEMRSADRRPMIWDPLPVPNAGVPRPVSRRTPHGNANLTPTLSAEDRAWLIAALAQLTAAVGRPRICPPIPALVAAEPAAAATEPAPAVLRLTVQTLRDEPSLLALIWPAVAEGEQGRTTYCGMAALLVLSGALIMWYFGSTSPAGKAVAYSLFAAAVVAAACLLFCAFATVRAIVDRDRRGEPRVRRLVGIGPFRWRSSVRGTRLQAVALGCALLGNPDGDAAPLRSRAYLVTPERPRWLRGWVPGAAVPLVNGRGAGGSVLAEEVAGRVVAKLTELGWRSNPPADWRFGWTSSAGTRRR